MHLLHMLQQTGTMAELEPLIANGASQALVPLESKRHMLLCLLKSALLPEKIEAPQMHLYLLVPVVVLENYNIES